MPSASVFNETRFRTLLERWNHHQDLRSSGAPLRELAESRFALDAVRFN